MARSLAILGAVIVIAPSPLHAAAVRFDDGQIHTLPGYPAWSFPDAWVLLENGSTLIVDRENIQPPPLFSNADIPTALAAVTTSPGTTLRIGVPNGWGGGLRGQLTQATADAGTPTTGISAVSGAGLDLGGELLTRSGIIAGGDVRAEGIAGIVRVEADAGAGILIRSGRAMIDTAEAVGGGVAYAKGSSQDNFATGGDGLVLTGSATTIVGAGSVQGGDGHCDNGLFAAGHCTARGGHGASVLEGSTAVVYGRGDPWIIGGSAFSDAGFASGDATAIPGHAMRIEDGTHVAIYGGHFTTGIASTASAGTPQIAPAVAALRLDVTGSADATCWTILGGTFRGDSSLEIPYTSATPPPGPILPGAVVSIVGGDFDSGGAVDLRLAHPGVFTILMATGATVNGEPITGPLPTSGTIAGVLAMGPAFEWTYALENGAILGVPEPTTGLLPGLLALTTLVRLRRRSDA